MEGDEEGEGETENGEKWGGCEKELFNQGKIQKKKQFFHLQKSAAAANQGTCFIPNRSKPTIKAESVEVETGAGGTILSLRSPTGQLVTSYQ